MHCGFDGCFYFYSTEQIKPEHIVGEDSLDNDEDSNKGEILDHVHYTVSILVRIGVFKHFDATDSKCPCGGPPSQNITAKKYNYVQNIIWKI